MCWLGLFVSILLGHDMSLPIFLVGRMREGADLSRHQKAYFPDYVMF